MATASARVTLKPLVMRTRNYRSAAMILQFVVAAKQSWLLLECLSILSTLYRGRTGRNIACLLFAIIQRRNDLKVSHTIYQKILRQPVVMADIENHYVAKENSAR
jgi:hypothetical protein